MDHRKPENCNPSLIPGKIVAVYAIIGCLWIFISDTLLESTVTDPHLLLSLAMLKGGSFVLVTSALLYLLIRRHVASLRHANESLRVSERRFTDLMERVHMIALMLDTKGDITFCNDFLLELSGWSRDELLGRNWFETFIPADIRGQVNAIFRQGIAGGDLPFHYENRILTRGGGECQIVWDNTLLRDAEGSVTGVACLGMDVTRQRSAEAQLLQSQKMESIGTLAGGVAHDFNNILTVIMNSGEMLRKRLDDRERAILLVDQILGSAQRAAKLTRSLLAFSRKQQIVPRAIDLNEIISQMHGFLERIIGEDVELMLELGKGDVTVLADRGQIEQVLMNLVSNARDAMPEGGRLTISTGVSIMDGQVLADGSTATGRYALLTLADNGIGISRQEQNRIFEPFFTTKDVGRGTGLGLSMAYGIVRQHNGLIDVESELGRGSRFMVYLPLAAAGGDLGIAPAETSSIGTETILVVEDDVNVLKANGAMLEEGGYRVVPANSGDEALELFRAQEGAIDLAIIDVVMPQMNGRQVYEELMKLKPSLPVLFVSGYTSDVLDRTGIPENCPFIAKPMTSRELLHAVRKLLDCSS